MSRSCSTVSAAGVTEVGEMGIAKYDVIIEILTLDCLNQTRYFSQVASKKCTLHILF